MHSNLTTSPVAFTGTLQPIPLSVAPRQHPAAHGQPYREPIRHLLIGSPTLVQHTIHQLHNLHYAEAGLWSPAIALPNTEITITLNPGEVLRILLRYRAIGDVVE
ncbi:MAG: hypothetical protein HC879_22740 [Leptolyngbyaceae cyanobacterium SL_5_9]|nr:hypothetical protein [Leptolyngbyaceae cyanobacterium SL_5_9]NJO75418.1 hypothetical protein [Leptolyngbyaceae cyanobacterium RM1_406_9]